MPKPQYCTLTVLTIPSAAYTSANAPTGDPINLAVSHDVHIDAHTGYLRDCQVIVEQTAGSGNTNGQKFVISVETSRTPTGPWINLKLVTPIELTTNGAASYASTVQGPLSGYIRVKATAHATPSATFSAYIIAGG